MRTGIRKVFLACLLTFFVSSLVVGSVSARGGTFIVSPKQEVREVVKLSPKDKVSGNVVVRNGTIDFYVTNPSRHVVLCYNQTEGTSFNFTALERGNYTMHLFNSFSPENVTVQLNYSFDLTLEFQVNVGFKANVGTLHFSQTATVAPSPFDWLSFIQEIVKVIISGLVPVFISKIKAFIDWLKWIKKYKKSRTPIVIVERVQ